MAVSTVRIPVYSNIPIFPTLVVLHPTNHSRSFSSPASLAHNFSIMDSYTWSLNGSFPFTDPLFDPIIPPPFYGLCEVWHVETTPCNWIRVGVGIGVGGMGGGRVGIYYLSHGISTFLIKPLL